MQALIDAGLGKGSEAFEKLDKTRAGVLIGSGMGGLTVFQDGVKNLVEKGYRKISPFFIPYAITNMCAFLPAPVPRISVYCSAAHVPGRMAFRHHAVACGASLTRRQVFEAVSYAGKDII